MHDNKSSNSSSCLSTNLDSTITNHEMEGSVGEVMYDLNELQYCVIMDSYPLHFEQRSFLLLNFRYFTFTIIDHHFIQSNIFFLI